MFEYIFVYITAASQEEASKIARALVEDELAACANIIPGMHSIYRHEGEVKEADEVVMIVKTRADLFEHLTERVKRLHSYSCPCIVALPLVDGSPDYLQWIEDSTLPEDLED
ncbi:MAG: divalent-cation tolerance protein CutA [Alphaproteobacteria bacterium]|nr:divalent-cation tolerance protein CutA [Alphaproteobacteria bacterium]